MGWKHNVKNRVSSYFQSQYVISSSIEAPLNILGISGGVERVRKYEAAVKGKDWKRRLGLIIKRLIVTLYSIIIATISRSLARAPSSVL